MTDTHDTKVCSKCGEEKPIDLFGKDKYKKSGLKPSCKKCCNEQYKHWHNKNVEKLMEKYKKYNIVNKEKISKRKKEYFKKKYVQLMKYRKNYTKQKYKSCALFRLKQNIRNLIGIYLRNNKIIKNQKTEKILGCSFYDFKLHIERQFTSGMTWENRTKWHIDHIIPLASAKTNEDVIRLNHYTNLRPLWAKDNLSKGAKVEYLI